MISTIHGLVAQAGQNHLIVEVGGVGFHVNTTPAFSLAHREGTSASLHTSLIVREDALSLFGFGTRQELEVFELLIAVSGVGPKSALGVLSELNPEEVARAVHADDDAAFRKVSGIGPKTAKLIVLALTGRVSVPQGASLNTTPTTAAGEQLLRDNVLQALIGLGWNERESAAALDETIAEATDLDTATVSTLLRLTLARLGPAHAGRQR